MDKAGMEPTHEAHTGDAIRGAAEGAKEELSRLGDEVREKSASVFHEQRDMASRQINSVAKALDAGASSLEEDGQDRLAVYTRDAAERLRHLGDGVRERDFDSVMNNARQYAREHPAVVIGGAALLGLALSRFLKASSERSYDEDIGFEGEGTHRSRTGVTVASSEPPMDTSAPRYEGMAPGISPIGESSRVEDTGRRFGNGTES